MTFINNVVRTGSQLKVETGQLTVEKGQLKLETGQFLDTTSVPSRVASRH